MPKIVFIEHNGAQHVVNGQVGRSVMQTALDHQVPGILAECGGSCVCATCHGHIDAQWWPRLRPIQADEESLLEGLPERLSSSRLTCQIDLTTELDGLTVRLPKSQF
jgi:2Fe-2S ferredoxin